MKRASLVVMNRGNPNRMALIKAEKRLEQITQVWLLFSADRSQPSQSMVDGFDAEENPYPYVFMIPTHVRTKQAG